jgi:hypothetical protein
MLQDKFQLLLDSFGENLKVVDGFPLKESGRGYNFATGYFKLLSGREESCMICRSYSMSIEALYSPHSGAGCSYEHL